MEDQDRAKAYAKWLTKNADKKGTPEFRTVAEAYRKLRQGSQPKEQPNSYWDIAKGIGKGVENIAQGIMGLPGDLVEADRAATKWLTDKMGVANPHEQAAKFAPSPLDVLPTSQDVNQFQESTIGTLPSPETEAGQMVQKGTGYIGGALLGAGKGRAVKDIVRYGVAPFAADELAGRGAEAIMPGISPEARDTIGTGAAILTGGLGAITDRPKPVNSILGGATRNVTPQQFQEAIALQREAGRRGVKLTAAEALEQVTGGQTGMGNVQRVTEAEQPQIYAPTLANRGEQVQRAGENFFDRIALPTSEPQMVGPRASDAAGKAISGVRQDINRQSKPYYDAARDVKVPPAKMQGLMKNKYVQQALREIKSDPAWADKLPKTSTKVVTKADFLKQQPKVTQTIERVGTLDAVKRRLDELIEAEKASRDPKPFEIAALERARKQVVSVADKASQNYRLARQIQRQGRKSRLEPLEQGALGGVRSAKTTSDAAEALLPRSPMPGSEADVARAGRGIASKDKGAARQLLRQRLEGALQESLRGPRSGNKGWAGADFAKNVAGNPQQKKNLDAVVGAITDTATQQELNKLIEIFQATGKRQAPGSLTTFNTAAREAHSGAGIVEGAIRGASRPFGTFNESLKNWRIRRNSAKLAEAMVSPDSLERLANMSPEDRNKAVRSLARLILAQAGGQLAAQDE